MPDNFLQERLNARKEQHAFRQLRVPEAEIDFCSNDYLGVVRNRLVEQQLAAQDFPGHRTGSTGSRLLSGNYPLIEKTESLIAAFHEAPAGLLFNSGYDANTGLLSCVARRTDTILYDALSHASIRDGIRLSMARAYSFRHNDLDDLRSRLDLAAGTVFVVTESVFSMDGDMAPLQEIAGLCTEYGAHLVVDEAHATGVIGAQGQGLVQELGIRHQCFARVHTFGKACGVHGAIVLGSETLRDYLVNFSRPFIYTTALPEASVAAIAAAYAVFPTLSAERLQLRKLAALFRSASIPHPVLTSDTPIQAVIIPGNEAVKNAARQLQQQGLDVRPILYPSVPQGTERLRIVLHAYNTEEEIDLLVRGINQ